MYENCDIQIHVHGKAGKAHNSETSVKQGLLVPHCSDLVFDGLCRYIAAKCPSAGPKVGSHLRVPNLEYADDVLLLAKSPAELQQLLDTTENFVQQLASQLEQIRPVYRSLEEQRYHNTHGLTLEAP